MLATVVSRRVCLARTLSPRPMRKNSLLLLRISLGWLMVVWGVDKLNDVEHAARVSESFYAGVMTGPGALQAFGVVQTLIGVLIVMGFLRRFTYPFLLVITGVTLLAVWKSILDPWGFVLQGGNLVFYSSAVIFAGALVLYAFLADDTVALDARRVGGGLKQPAPKGDA